MRLHQAMSEFLSMNTIAAVLRKEGYSVKIEQNIMRVIDNRGATLIFAMQDLAAQEYPIMYIEDKLKEVLVKNLKWDGCEDTKPYKFGSVATSLECIGYKVVLDDEKEQMYVEVVSDSGRAVGRMFTYLQLESTQDSDIAGFVELAMNRAESDESNMFPRFLQDVGDELTKRGYDVAVRRDGGRIQVTKKLNDGVTIIREFSKTEVLDYINPPVNIIESVMGLAIEDHIEFKG